MTGVRKRMLRRIGTPVTVYNYEWSGDTDGYGDPVNFEESSDKADGVIEQINRPEQVPDLPDADVDVEEQIHLSEEIEIYDVEERERGSEIEFEETGDRYRVYYLRPDHNGLVTAFCSKV